MQNRVTPYGEIVSSPLRGQWMGNRGCIHDGTTIVRGWAGRRWIICALEYKGWIAPKWEPGRWTALFFHDERVALAAGHRPCALCRRAAYRAYLEAAGATSADEVDARLHAERLDRRRKRVHELAWGELPDGVFVDLEGTAAVVVGDALVEWSATEGYTARHGRPRTGTARVLTPPTSVRVLRAGYAASAG